MPTAHQGEVKYAYLDHDPYQQYLAPPTLNQWYTLADLDDARGIFQAVFQSNTEAAAKNIEVRWTIDGTIYFVTVTAVSGTWYYISKDFTPSNAGTTGLTSFAFLVTCGYYADKRGQDFKVEIRIVTALGTNQVLDGRFVAETLEQT